MPSIFDILKFDNFGIGKVQSVDEMCVVPLIGKSRNIITEPSNLQFRKTSDYGSMIFVNKDSNKPAIVPANIMVRGINAQDHAMSCSGVIEASKFKSFNNACCIEESQGGLLDSNNNQEDVLPIELRKHLLNYDQRIKCTYNKLWYNIKEWLKGVGIENKYAHLNYFYDNADIKKELEVFAAEFEPVDGQMGAVILFGGVPVGLEIMPSENHWNTYWKQLIRGCYGAELIRLKKMGEVSPSTLILPDIPDKAQVEQVQLIIEEFAKYLSEAVIPLLENINISSNSEISSIAGLDTRLIITSTGGGGDVIFSGSEPIYVSLVI